MPGHETLRETAKEIPVFSKCEVLVVGGGPAGCAATASLAAVGVDTLLMERYGYLGGMSTGGLVLWIDRMSDWEGRQVIAGFANDLLGRLPKEALLGAPREMWGSRDSEMVNYWKDRASAFNGVVTWSPTIDLEMMKMAYFETLESKGVKLLLHAWAVAPIQDGNQIKGVIFESKAGRQAIYAKVVIDATGDGDIFSMAGESFESDINKESWHHQMNVAFLWAGVDMERFLRFRNENRKAFESLTQQARHEFKKIDARGYETGVLGMPHLMPRNDVCLFMSPKLEGYNCLRVEDLTEVELVSRRIMMKMLDFYRRNIPGFEGAWVMLTAPQMGVRHSRRLRGVTKMTKNDWRSGIRYEDEIGVSTPPDTKSANVSIPLGCLIPESLDNILGAGRNLSCDAITHNFMRLIPQCWETGQAAGVAAAVAINSGVNVRNVAVTEVQQELIRQGVYLNERSAGSIEQRA